MVPNLGGQILGAIIAAGAFAAFLSTSSGLVVSVAGRGVDGHHAGQGA